MTKIKEEDAFDLLIVILILLFLDPFTKINPSFILISVNYRQDNFYSIPSNNLAICSGAGS